MKTFIKILLVALLGTTLLQAAAFEKQAKTRAAKVMLISEKPLTTGHNRFKITIAGDKFKDADVSIKVFMPAMPGMPYMESVAEATNLGNGTYEANINLAMGGTWQVHIFISPKKGKRIRAKTSINI